MLKRFIALLSAKLPRGFRFSYNADETPPTILEHKLLPIELGTCCEWIQPADET
jgi:hypothetical protein